MLVLLKELKLPLLPSADCGKYIPEAANINLCQKSRDQLRSRPRNDFSLYSTKFFYVKRYTNRFLWAFLEEIQACLALGCSSSTY